MTGLADYIRTVQFVDDEDAGQKQEQFDPGAYIQSVRSDPEYRRSLRFTIEGKDDDGNQYDATPAQRLQAAREVLDIAEANPSAAQKTLTFLEHTPLTKKFVSWARSGTALAASRRVASGDAAPEDYLAIAGFQKAADDQERAGFLSKAADVLIEMPDFMASIAASGPLYSAAKKATEKGIEKAIGKGLVRSAVGSGIGAAVGTGARFAHPTPLAGVATEMVERGAGIASPQVVIDQNDVSQLKWNDDADNPLATVLPQAFVSQYIENYSEMLGGPLTKAVNAVTPQVAKQAMSGLKAALANDWIRRHTNATVKDFLQTVAKEGGYSSVFGEFLEERAAEALHGAAGLAAPKIAGRGDFGMMGDVATGAKQLYQGQPADAGESFRSALSQLATEALAFGAIPVAQQVGGIVGNAVETGRRKADFFKPKVISTTIRDIPPEQAADQWFAQLPEAERDQRAAAVVALSTPMTGEADVGEYPARTPFTKATGLPPLSGPFRQAFVDRVRQLTQPTPVEQPAQPQEQPDAGPVRSDTRPPSQPGDELRQSTIQGGGDLQQQAPGQPSVEQQAQGKVPEGRQAEEVAPPLGYDDFKSQYTGLFRQALAGDDAAAQQMAALAEQYPELAGQFEAERPKGRGLKPTEKPAEQPAVQPEAAEPLPEPGIVEQARQQAIDRILELAPGIPRQALEQMPPDLLEGQLRVVEEAAARRGKRLAPTPTTPQEQPREEPTTPSVPPVVQPSVAGGKRLAPTAPVEQPPVEPTTTPVEMPAEEPPATVAQPEERPAEQAAQPAQTVEAPVEPTGKALTLTKQKPLWAMTRDEYVRSVYPNAEGPGAFPDLEQRHSESVSTAVRFGLPVPASVLADYPDLQPKAPVGKSLTTAPTAPSVAPERTEADTAQPSTEAVGAIPATPPEAPAPSGRGLRGKTVSPRGQTAIPGMEQEAASREDEDRFANRAVDAIRPILTDEAADASHRLFRRVPSLVRKWGKIAADRMLGDLDYEDLKDMTVNELADEVDQFVWEDVSSDLPPVAIGDLRSRPLGTAAESKALDKAEEHRNDAILEAISQETRRSLDAELERVKVESKRRMDEIDAGERSKEEQQRVVEQPEPAAKPSRGVSELTREEVDRATMLDRAAAMRREAAEREKSTAAPPDETLAPTETPPTALPRLTETDTIDMSGLSDQQLRHLSKQHKPQHYGTIADIGEQVQQEIGRRGIRDYTEGPAEAKPLLDAYMKARSEREAAERAVTTANTHKNSVEQAMIVDEAHNKRGVPLGGRGKHGLSAAKKYEQAVIDAKRAAAKRPEMQKADQAIAAAMDKVRELKTAEEAADRAWSRAAAQGMPQIPEGQKRHEIGNRYGNTLIVREFDPERGQYRVEGLGGNEYYVSPQPLLDNYISDEEAKQLSAIADAFRESANAAESKRVAAEQSKRSQEASEAAKVRKVRDKERFVNTRFWNQLKQRAHDLETTKQEEKIVEKDGIVKLKREIIDDTWMVRQEPKTEDGKSGGFSLVHRPTNTVASAGNNANEAKQLYLLAVQDGGIDLSKLKEGEKITPEQAKLFRSIERAWDKQDLDELGEDEQSQSLKTKWLESAKTPAGGIVADVVLDGSDFVGADDAVARIKLLASEVPEFAYDPVFTVDSDKKLVYRDGFKYRFEPKTLNVEPFDLKPGMTIGINLEDLGIKRKTAQDVVAEVLSNQGFSVTKSAKAGTVKAKWKLRTITAIPEKGDETKWSVLERNPDADRAREIINAIRWKQPGETEAQKTLKIVPQGKVETGISGPPQEQSGYTKTERKRLADIMKAGESIRKKRKGKSLQPTAQPTEPTEDVSETRAAPIDTELEDAIAVVEQRIADATPENQKVYRSTLVPEIDNARSGMSDSRQRIIDQAEQWRGEAQQAPSPLKAKAEQAASEASKVAAEIKKMLKTELGVGVNPRILPLLVKYGSLKIKEGVLRFADYVQSMVAEFGASDTRKMARYIEESWDWAREQNPDAGLDETQSVVDMVAEPVAPPTESAPAEAPKTERPTDVTSIKNAVVDELRDGRGLPEFSGVEPQTQQQWISDAESAIADDPTLPDRIVDELLATPRNLRTDEVAVLQLHYRRLNNAYQSATGRMVAAKDANDSEGTASALHEAELILNQLDQTEQAVRLAGREWGRSGVARQIELLQDFSLAQLTRRARTAKGGEQLTAEETAEIQKMAERIKSLEDKLKASEEARVNAEREAAANKAIAEEKKETEKKPAKEKTLSSRKQSAKQAISDAWADFKSAWQRASVVGAISDPMREGKKQVDLVVAAGKVVKAYIDMGVVTFSEFWNSAKENVGDTSAEVRDIFKTAWDSARDDGTLPDSDIDKENFGAVRRLARKIMRAVVEGGITEREEVVDAVWDDLKGVLPDITRRQAMDAMSGYGDYRELDKDEVSVVVRDINGQLQQLAKLEDMESGQAPKKTGVERRTPSDEERDLIKRVNESKKRGGYTVTDPERQLKSALGAAKTAVRNRITDLEKEIATREKIVKERTPLKPDAELEKLRKRRDELLEVHREIFPPTPKTDAEKIEAASRALDRAIAQLEADITSGNIGRKITPSAPSSPELDAKRTKLDALRATLAELRENDPAYQAETEQRQNAAYKRSLLNRLAEYKDKIARGDFAPVRRDDRNLPQDIVDTRFQLKQERDRFKLMQEAWLRKRWSVPAKILDGISETLNFSRSVMTSFDFSAVMRQGGFVVASHPIMAAKAIPDMLRAAMSEKAEFEQAERLRLRPLAQLGERAGLAITVTEGKLSRQEEAYMGHFLQRAPKWLGVPIFPIKASERAYVGFLNRIRADLFDAMVGSVERRGKITLDEAKVLAKFVNAVTGRGSLGAFEAASVPAATLFFSPKFVVSRFQLLLGVPMWKGNARTRAAIAKEYSKALIGMGLFFGVVYMASKLLWDDDDKDKPTLEFDPRSSDFGKVKIGNTRIDPLAGLSQASVLMARLSTGETKKTTGQIVPIRGPDVPFRGTTESEVLGRFVRQKLSPWLGSSVDLVTGTNAIGQPSTPQDIAVRMAIPLSLSDIGDTMKEQGIPAGTAMGLLSIMGFGLQTYSYTPKRPEWTVDGKTVSATQDQYEEFTKASRVARDTVVSRINFKDGETSSVMYDVLARANRNAVEDLEKAMIAKWSGDSRGTIDPQQIGIGVIAKMQQDAKALLSGKGAPDPMSDAATPLEERKRQFQKRQDVAKSVLNATGDEIPSDIKSTSSTGRALHRSSRSGRSMRSLRR